MYHITVEVIYLEINQGAAGQTFHRHKDIPPDRLCMGDLYLFCWDLYMPMTSLRSTPCVLLSWSLFRSDMYFVSSREFLSSKTAPSSSKGILDTGVENRRKAAAATETYTKTVNKKLLDAIVFVVCLAITIYFLRGSMLVKIQQKYYLRNKFCRFNSCLYFLCRCSFRGSGERVFYESCFKT